MDEQQRFDVDGARYGMSEMLAANQDDEQLCEWLRSAKPGDVFADMQRVECVAA